MISHNVARLVDELPPLITPQGYTPNPSPTPTPYSQPHVTRVLHTAHQTLYPYFYQPVFINLFYFYLTFRSSLVESIPVNVSVDNDPSLFNMIIQSYVLPHSLTPPLLTAQWQFFWVWQVLLLFRMVGVVKSVRVGPGPERERMNIYKWWFEQIQWSFDVDQWSGQWEDWTDFGILSVVWPSHTDNMGVHQNEQVESIQVVSRSTFMFIP